MGMFKPASRHKLRLRMAIDGPSGAGKTFTGLRFASALAGDSGRIAAISTESGAIEKYLGLAPDGRPWQFDVAYLPDFSPTTYAAAIQAAGREGYDVLLVDSLSHAWEGDGGALELVDRRGGNRYTAWKDVTPMHRRMVESILRSPCHVICTMRSKTAHVLETDAAGKQVPRKVGMEPIQRPGMEYEFDLYANLDWTHTLQVSKTRCPAVDGAIAVKPGAAWIEPVVEWLNDGIDTPAGYYTASEADIERSIAAREAEERSIAQASGRRPAAASGKAAIAEAAAKRATASAAAPASSPSSSSSTTSQAQVVDQAADQAAGKIAPTAAATSTEATGQAQAQAQVDSPMKRARRTARSATAATKPATAIDDPPFDPDPTTPGSISSDQAKRLEAYFDRLEVPPASREAALARRGANAVRNLSAQAADGLIAALMERELGLDQVKAQAAAKAAADRLPDDEGESKN